LISKLKINKKEWKTPISDPIDQAGIGFSIQELANIRRIINFHFDHPTFSIGIRVNEFRGAG
jgi:hypothetical protein